MEQVADGESVRRLSWRGGQGPDPIGCIRQFILEFSRETSVFIKEKLQEFCS